MSVKARVKTATKASIKTNKTRPTPKRKGSQIKGGVYKQQP